MDHQLNQKNNFVKLFVLAVFFVYLYLAYNTPLTHDDWTWGTSDGLARLNTGFKDYNGRYLGNLFELFLTRVYWIRFIIMALFSTMLIYLVAKTTTKSPVISYTLGFLLFICIPVNIISQTYAWVAGFSNYITSIVFVLIYLVIIKNIFEEKLPKYNKLQAVLVIPLGIATQLFVEHVTIYTIFMAFFVVCFSVIKFKKIFAVHIIYLISTIIGAAIMFSNGAYIKIISGSDGYRSIEAAGPQVGFFKKIFDVYTEQMYPLLFLNNVILNIFISFFCIIIILKAKKSYNFLLKYFLLSVLTIYPFYKLLVINSFRISFFDIYNNEFVAFISALFYLCILGTVLFYISGSSLKLKISFYLISVIILAAPLIFVHPFGPRCFLAPYTFFVLSAIEMSIYIIDNKYFNLKVLNKIFCIGAIFVCSCYIYAFTMNGAVNRERIDYIKNHVKSNDSTIILTHLPFEQFLWHSTPVIPSYQYNTFKEYYGIPSKTKLKEIPYSSWKEINH